MQKLLGTQQHPHLRRLSISTGALPLRDPHLFSAPIFQNLTHLDIGVAGRLASLSTGAREFGRRIPWDSLHTLEHLIHLHLDLSIVYRFSDPDEVAPEVREVVSEMLTSTPPRLSYVAVLFPFDFLFEAAKSANVEGRQVYEDLVKGNVDRRVVVGTSAGKFEYQEEKAKEAERTKEVKKAKREDAREEQSEEEEEEMLTVEQAERLLAFGEWMIQSPRSERVYRICEVRGDRRIDFWKEVETVERRNQQLHSDGLADSYDNADFAAIEVQCL